MKPGEERKQQNMSSSDNVSGSKDQFYGALTPIEADPRTCTITEFQP